MNRLAALLVALYLVAAVALGAVAFEEKRNREQQERIDQLTQEFLDAFEG